jgi:nitroreductase
LELRDCINNRQSIRSFDPDKDIPQEKIEEILEVAIRAPSAANLQPWSFIITGNIEIKNKLAEASGGQKFIVDAPWLITILAHPQVSSRRFKERGEELYCIQDTAALIQNILLLITEEGLASCWIGAFNEKRVAEILDIDKTARPVAILPVGYPINKPPYKDRKPLKEIIKWFDR